MAARYLVVMRHRESNLFPALIKHWRTRRGLSQLDLALAADVSSRHVSFLETGRAQPSREMILRLASALSVPLRDQNALLAAADYPEAFPEPPVDEGLAGRLGAPPNVFRMLFDPRLMRPFFVDWERAAERDPRRAAHRELFPARRAGGRASDWSSR